MPLSFFTKQLIEMKRDDLKKRLRDHETGEMPLISEVVTDYKNDADILDKLLNGEYERMEANLLEIY